MTLPTLVMSVVFGVFAGWLAGIALRDGGHGLRWDIVFGFSGSIVGSWLLQALQAPEAGSGATSIAAFIGAALVIVAQRKFWPAPAHS